MSDVERKVLRTGLAADDDFDSVEVILTRVTTIGTLGQTDTSLTGDVLTGAPTRAVRRGEGSLTVHLGSDWFAWFADAYRSQDAAWVASIRSGVPAGPTAWDGYVSQLAVDAIMESLATGRTVDVVSVERPPLYR